MSVKRRDLVKYCEQNGWAVSHFLNYHQLILSGLLPALLLELTVEPPALFHMVRQRHVLVDIHTDKGAFVGSPVLKSQNIVHCFFDKMSDSIKTMQKQTEEWMKQSEYDMETADYMYNGGRYIYAVFMCHLAIEKALKGLFFEKMLDVPPKTHNLIYLLNRMRIKPPDEPGRFIARLSEASIPIRYPEKLAKLKQIYTKEVTSKILTDGKACIVWIKQKL